MKQPWWALLVVAALGVGAGVGASVLVGDETSADSPLALEPGSAPPADGTTTTTTTTISATTETILRDTGGTATSTSTSTSTTTTTTIEPIQPPLGEITIVIANGDGTPGLASSTADLLRVIGYPDVEAVDGTEVAEATVVYVRDGLEPTAERVIEDIKIIIPAFVLPASTLGLDEAPALRPAVADADIIVYLSANAP